LRIGVEVGPALANACAGAKRGGHFVAFEFLAVLTLG
jgi:hypothetical protein